MSKWVTRTVLSGASIAANGTASHTCTFTAASSGNFLVAVVAGAVTFTTPSGWTLVNSAVNNCGLYVFTKTASASESSFSTTHNGSDYAIRGVIYEFAAGTSTLGSSNNNSQAANATTPVVSSLTGTYSRFGVRCWNMASASTTASCVWTTPTVEDLDDYVSHTTQDGVFLTIAYDDGITGSTFTPSSAITLFNAGGTGEAVSFALTVVDPPAGLTAMPWFRF